jgi:hypothetical protein
MKKTLRMLFVISMLSALVVTAVHAETGSVPGGGWWTGEMVQNVGTGNATVVVTAYGGGNQYATTNVTLAPQEAKNFTPSDFAGMVDGFQGAAVVQADQPIKAIVNVTNRPSGSFGITGGEAAAQYQGVDGAAVATTLYFPMAKNNRFGKTTSFYIQNAGTAAATATATFKMDDGNTYSYTTPSIQPSEMVIIVPSDASVPTSGTNRNNIGSVQVTSTSDLAGVVMEYVTGESPAKLLQATRGFTAQDFDTTLYAPTIKQDRFDRFTGIQVQNVSAGAINVTITFKGSRGACTGATYTASVTNLAAGSSKTFNQIAGSDGEMINDCAASATIVATGNIVATVNESFTNDAVAAGTKQASTTYSAFPAASTTMSIGVPMYKENRFDKYTGLMIQNVSANSASVTIQFIGAAGTAAGNTYTTVAQTIPAGGSLELSRISEKAASFWSGTAAPTNSTYGVKVTSNRNVVAIANEAVYPTAALQQDKNNYEGFNLP